jgi:uncharacterized low-complexity protein
MEIIMRIKTYISNAIAVFTLIALVSGFQFSTEKSTTASENLTSIESVLGIEDAYAGPCGRAGCDGEPTYCTAVTVLNIGSIQIIKHCQGTPVSQFQ